MSEKPSNEQGLFPDLAPYGPIRPMPEQKQADVPGFSEKKPATEVVRSAYDSRFQLSDRFSKHGVTTKQSIEQPAVLESPTDDNFVPLPQPDSELPVRTAKKRGTHSGIIMAIIVALAVLSTGTYLLLGNKHPKTSNAKSSTPKVSTAVNIPIYLPTNLPAGYVYNNDKKLVSPNVYSMSVTGPNKEYFYVTEQALPINNDFTPFEKQLTDPRSYDSTIGKVTTGSTKSSFIVSISTVKNTWVIINSPNTSSQKIITPLINSLSL